MIDKERRMRNSLIKMAIVTVSLFAGSFACFMLCLVEFHTYAMLIGAAMFGLVGLFFFVGWLALLDVRKEMRNKERKL